MRKTKGASVNSRQISQLCVNSMEWLESKTLAAWHRWWWVQWRNPNSVLATATNCSAPRLSPSVCLSRSLGPPSSTFLLQWAISFANPKLLISKPRIKRRESSGELAKTQRASWALSLRSSRFTPRSTSTRTWSYRQASSCHQVSCLNLDLSRGHSFLKSSKEQTPKHSTRMKSKIRSPTSQGPPLATHT